MTEFIKKITERIDQSLSESKTFDVPQKNIQQILKYLKHDILLSLYRKNPIVEGNEEKTKFNIELNKKIEDLYYKNFQSSFNHEIHLKNKQLPLFLMGMPGDGKITAYQIAAKEVCENLGLTLVTDLSADYIPKQTDFIISIKEDSLYNTNFEDAKKWDLSNITVTDMRQIFANSDFKDISTWDMSNIQSLEEIAEGVKIQKKSHELNAEDAKKINMQDYCAGMMFVVDDVKNIEMAMVTSSNYNKSENIYVGFTGNLEQLINNYNLSDTLTDAVIPIVVNNSLDNENVANVSLNKTTISQNVKETLANIKATQETRLKDVPPRIANIAEDLVINGKLIKGFKMNPVKLLSEAGFGMKPDEAEKYHNMAEEVVAEMLLIEERKKKQKQDKQDKQDKQEQGQQGQKQQGGGGSGSESGEPGDEDENDSSNSKDKNQSKGNKPKDKDESKEKGENKQGGGSGEEENVSLNKKTISQNVKETLANFKAPQETNKIKNNM